MGTRLDLTATGRGLRSGAREETRYTHLPGPHSSALVIASASGAFATLVVLCAALLRG
ncbi:hypothetical protein SAMN05192565_12616 [Methylobacterium gossipiicola]|uniref:Uncharacterized protein n=1 Tax=Methylobacterium gossipiicola TaxID=582675 RepID=A0A1I2WQ98_9HYPH|nr:hypothetical protein SAMN05192565_12616 [Methylobacterium gossipiicola]